MINEIYAKSERIILLCYLPAVVETPRGLITLGAAVYHGIEQKHVDNLMDCVKGCANAGGGIAATPDVILQSPQLCFGIDYDFAAHKCYFHTLVKVCGAADAAVILTSAQTYAKASSVNILLCEYIMARA
jgi:hypothetical protein